MAIMTHGISPVFPPQGAGMRVAMEELLHEAGVKVGQWDYRD